MAEAAGNVAALTASASRFPWRDGWPLPALTDDGNEWTTGMCWLYCRREGVRVLWVGSVNSPGATGSLYACGPCLAELDHMVRVQTRHTDRPPSPLDRPPSPPAGRRHA